LVSDGLPVSIWHTHCKPANVLLFGVYSSTAEGRQVSDFGCTVILLQEGAMGYLLVRHKVKQYDEWKKVFEAQKSAQWGSGLRVEKVLRNLYEPNEVFLFFEVTDLAKAREFVFSPGVPGAQAESGVVDKTDIYFLA
jgi:hypothetical protein